MPHSSGGSSHSGGSHHSSSSHSSSGSRSGGSGGGGSSRRSSSQPFPGSKRYLYYKDSKPYFVYSNYDVRKKNMSMITTWIIIVIMFFAPFIASTTFCTVDAVNFPEKINYYKGKRVEFVIEDNLGIFEDEKSLKHSMKEFYNETGIVPAVIAVSNETWNSDYSNLEAYAYDVSVDRFPDEAHWLIIYSESIKDNGFNDWYCEGMQGDRTDPVITGPRGDAFTDSLYKRLLQRDKYSVDEAIAETFDEFTPQMMKVSLKNEAQFYVFLFMTVMLLAGSVLSLLWSIHKTKVPEVYKNAKPCDLTAVYQEPCNFCGGIYIIGMHTECPHCGAALPAHHYMKDEQGNVVQIM